MFAVLRPKAHGAERDTIISVRVSSFFLTLRSDCRLILAIVPVARAQFEMRPCGQSETKLARVFPDFVYDLKQSLPRVALSMQWLGSVGPVTLLCSV